VAVEIAMIACAPRVARKNSNAIQRSSLNDLRFTEIYALNLRVYSKNTVVAVKPNYTTWRLSVASPNYRLL